MSESAPTQIAVVGLGKLGAAMAAALASRGCSVIGVDRDPAVVELVNAGEAPVEETGLAEMMSANSSRIRATTDVAEAIAASELSFVIVPTPSNPDGGFAVNAVVDAASAIGAALPRTGPRHTVALTSTVMPGATRASFVTALEHASGLTAGEGFGVCYSPSFIALGSVIHDYLHPDLVLIGEYDSPSGDVLERLYGEVLLRKAQVRRMNMENAELAKLAVNTFLTTKITFANMLADICDSIPNTNVDVISDALGADSRIGRKYLTGGLGYGGPCFPRDNAALASLSRGLGVTADLSEATDRMNRTLAKRVANDLIAQYRPNRVAILGLSYKPGSVVVDESQGLALASELAKLGCVVSGFDPLVKDKVQIASGDSLVLYENLHEVEGADLIVIANADPMFARLEALELQGATVVDFWGMLDTVRMNKTGATYRAFGRSAS